MSVVTIDPTDVAAFALLTDPNLKGLPVNLLYASHPEQGPTQRHGKLESVKGDVVTVADCDGTAGKYRAFNRNRIIGPLLMG
jgi:hypothetical protein